MSPRSQMIRRVRHGERQLVGGQRRLWQHGERRLLSHGRDRAGGGPKVSCRRVLRLEAVMEAGGFDINKANMKKVTVLRHNDGQLKRYVLNLQRVLEGHSKLLFYVRPNDIVYVPEKSF